MDIFRRIDEEKQSGPAESESPSPPVCKKRGTTEKEASIVPDLCVVSDLSFDSEDISREEDLSVRIIHMPSSLLSPTNFFFFFVFPLSSRYSSDID